MEKYSMVKLYNSNYNYLIIANTYENPIDDFLTESFPYVENGDIIFDLTIINGVKKNRFLAAKVMDYKLIPSSFAIVLEIEDNIKLISHNHFLNNKEIVENSCLPNALKFLLINGMLNRKWGNNIVQNYN